jgi:WD40 repeat protein
VAYSFKASEKSVSSMSTVDVGDGKTRIITGGEEPCVKVWNLTTDPPSTDMVMNTNGAVTHTEVNWSNIMWSIEEPLAGDAPGVPVGMVHLLDIGSQTTLPVKRSEDMPYTHPQPVRSIAIAIDNNIPYVVTAGTEGNIMCWRFEGGQFVKLSLCEGHTRAVTCLLFHEGMLWSGAGDRTLRVWDITSGRCVGTIKSAPGNSDGHADAVSCLEKIPAVAGAQDASSYVASGSIDGELKLWRPNGEFVYSCNNGAGITALRCFQDELGGQQSLLIGLFDGSMRIRSCATMALLVKLDSTLCRTQTIWSIADLGGRSCFASGGADGQCIMWQVCAPLRDSNSS